MKTNLLAFGITILLVAAMIALVILSTKFPAIILCLFFIMATTVLFIMTFGLVKDLITKQ